MASDHEQSGAGQNRSANDALDRELDAALRQYAAVESRAGLDERILANLRVDRERSSANSWLRWGAALAAVVVIAVVLAAAWRAGRGAHLPLANHSTTEQIRRPANPPVAAAKKRLVGNTPTKATHVGGETAMRNPAPQAQAVAESDPKLDVFPSPQPLTEEELALAQYVRNFPSEAKLVAQAQEASEREVLAKMQALASESTESN
jgi:hypothetical protein